MLNQLRNAKHEVSLPPQGDFLISRKFILEIGGKNKSKRQIKGMDHAFIAMDDMETGMDSTIPLWLFGMLY